MSLQTSVLSLVACCCLVTGQQIWDPMEARFGVINGRLVDMLDDGIGGVGRGVLGANGRRTIIGGAGGVGIGVGVGVGVGGAVGGAGWWRGLQPCRLSVCLPELIPDMCRYTPIRTTMFGRCFGCPINLCSGVGGVGVGGGVGGVGVGIGVGIGVGGVGGNFRRNGAGGRRVGRGRRGRGRGGRGGRGGRRGNVRKIQRQVCRRLGICTFGNQAVGGVGAGVGVGVGGLGGVGVRGLQQGINIV